jgi:hypothetical protein
MDFTLGSIIALIGLIIIIVGHLCTTVWWMAKITTTLNRMADDVSKALIKIEGLVPKTDCQRMHDHMDKRIDDIWKKIDEK